MNLSKLNQDYPNIVLFLEALISLIYGLLSAFVFNFTPREATMAGMLVFLICSIVNLGVQVRSVLIKSSEVDIHVPLLEKLKKIKVKDSKLYSELYNLIELTNEAYIPLNSEGICTYNNKLYGALDNCQKEIEDVKSKRIFIPPEEVREVWIDVLRNTKQSYLTTNIEHDASFGRFPDSDLVEAQKQMLKKIGKDNFIRIFLYENESELERLNNTFKEQSKLGLTVGYLSIERFKELSKSSNFQMIDSPNFTIIDGKDLYLTHVENKKSRGVVILGEGLVLKSAKRAFNQLKQEAKFLDEKS